MACCILLIQPYNFIVRRYYRHSLLMQERRMKPKVTHRASPGLEGTIFWIRFWERVVKVWSYGETGPAFLDDNLAFSQEWHGFMPFPPLPEGCCHEATLSKLCWGWQFLSTWFVCLFVFKSFNIFSTTTAFMRQAVCVGQPVTPHKEE